MSLAAIGMIIADSNHIAAVDPARATRLTPTKRQNCTPGISEAAERRNVKCVLSTNEPQSAIVYDTILAGAGAVFNMVVKNRELPGR
jgi:hypothetical protein